MERRQLLALGLGRGAAEEWIARGWLHPVLRGVYAVGRPAIPRQGRWMAAVLAVGPGSALSHRAAAAHWGIRPPGSGPVDVTAPGRALRSRSGVRVHRHALPGDEVTIRDGISTTTVPRTILDLASVLAPAQVERALNEAEIRRLDDALSLADLVARYPGRRGIRTVRAVVARQAVGATVTRSDLEAEFLAFLDAFGLPRPVTNVRLSLGYANPEVDCVWPQARLVVELDSRAYHLTAAAFEEDRLRDRALVAAGYRTVRVTGFALRSHPERLARDLRATLGTFAIGTPR